MVGLLLLRPDEGLQVVSVVENELFRGVGHFLVVYGNLVELRVENRLYLLYERGGFGADIPYSFRGSHHVSRKRFLDVLHQVHEVHEIVERVLDLLHFLETSRQFLRV